VTQYCKHGTESPFAVKGGELVTTDKLPPCHKELCLADMVTAVATVLSVTGVLTTGDYSNNTRSVTGVVPTDDYSNNTPVSNWCGAKR